MVRPLVRHSMVHPGSGSKWNPITPSPHHPLCRSGYLVTILFTTFTPSSTSGKAISTLTCETHLANGGITTERGSSAQLGATASKSREIFSSMGPAMLLSLFTAAAIADICHLHFFPPEGPLGAPLLHRFLIIVTTTFVVIVGPCAQ